MNTFYSKKALGRESEPASFCRVKQPTRAPPTAPFHTRDHAVGINVTMLAIVGVMVFNPTLLYYTLFYSTVLYCTLLYSTLLYSTLLYSTLLYSTLQLYSTLLYSTLLYSTLPYSSFTLLGRDQSGRLLPHCALGQRVINTSSSSDSRGNVLHDCRLQFVQPKFRIRFDMADSPGSAEPTALREFEGSVWRPPHFLKSRECAN